jgi:hypothetical protein
MVCTQDPYTLRSKSRLITFLVQQGLMNKLRGILHNTITRVRNKDAADSGKTQNSVSKAEKRPPYLPKNYLLYIPKSKDREHFTLVGSEHWTLILHENKDEEFLDLYLRNTARDQDDSQKDDAEATRRPYFSGRSEELFTKSGSSHELFNFSGDSHTFADGKIWSNSGLYRYRSTTIKQNVY